MRHLCATSPCVRARKGGDRSELFAIAAGSSNLPLLSACSTPRSGRSENEREIREVDYITSGTAPADHYHLDAAHLGMHELEQASVLAMF